MTEADVRKHQEPTAAVKQLHCQSASSQLITSSTRKPGDKRRAAEAQSDVTSPSKRHRAVDDDDGADCCTGGRLEDQENAPDQGVHGAPQQQHQQQALQAEQLQQCGDDCAPDVAKGGALTTIFSPLYLLYQGGHQLAQQLAGAYTGQQPQPGLPHSHDHHHLLPLTHEMQEAAEREQQHQQHCQQQQHENGHAHQHRQQQEQEDEQRQQEPARAANSTDSSEAEHTSGCPPRPPTPVCSTSTCSASRAHNSHPPQQPLVQSAPQPAAAVAAAATDEEDDEDDDCFDPYLFISRLPPLEACAGPGPRSVLLPCRTRGAKQKTLVLDLDETLVHSTLGAAPENASPDFSFPVTFNGAVHMVHVRQRPHMLSFLERVAALYEVVIFTASQKLYAEKLLNVLDPRRRLIRHRIYRDSCVLVEGNYLKDLSVLGRDLAHTLIVDNSPQAFGFQLDNGVPIESWYDDNSDDELLRLLPFLEQLAIVDDVRPHISERFRLRDVVRGAAAEGGGLVLQP